MNWINLTYKSNHKNTFENENIITCCLFNMLKHERKKFKEIYFDGFITTINQIKKYFTNWKIICYLDNLLLKTNPDLIKEFLNKYQNDENIKIYFYLIHKSINYSKNSHTGTIGSIVRFIPFFDNIKYKTIFSIDIDNTPKQFEELYLITKKYIDEFLQNDKFKIFIRNSSLDNQFMNYLDKKLDFIILGGFFISKIKFPINFLNNYIQELFTTNSKFDYGVDEIFLNNYILNYILENKFKIIVIKTYTLGKLYGIRKCNNELYNFYKNNSELLKKIEYYDKKYLYLNDEEMIYYKKLLIEFSTKMKQLQFKNNIPNSHFCKDKVSLIIDLPNIIKLDNSKFKICIY